MDIFEYLHADHEKVSKLFKQFEKTESSRRKREIMEFLAEELIKHARAEQTIFYSALEQFEESKDEALHGLKEHQEIEDHVSRILTKTTVDEAWIQDVEALKDLVDHHVSEEEGPLFRKAKKVLSEEEIYALKEQVHQCKQNIKLDF